MLPQKPDDDEIREARASFEQERLSRRAALRKVGIRTGVVAGLFFGFDDLVRMVGTRLEHYQASRGIADTVASDFRNMGLAFGDAIDECGQCGDCTPDEEFDCVDCADECPEASGQKKKPRGVCDGRGHYADCKKLADQEAPINCCDRRCDEKCGGTRNADCHEGCEAARAGG